jgi:predicted regulator of Ras-like GTPase activity (Roadblock/LC7/MglB family)
MATTSELDDRIEKCQRLLNADPNSQIFAALAEAYRKKGELDLAFRICKNGLKVHNNYGSAHIVMAKINLDRGLYDWAEIEAKRASELDGNTRTIELLLAEIYIYKGEFKSATKLLKDLRSKDPDNPQIKKLLEIARKLPEEQQQMIQSEPDVDDAIEITEIEGSDSGSVPIAVKKVDLSSVMEEAVAVKGIKGTFLVSHDGLVAESRWNLEIDITECGAIISDVWSMVSGEVLNKSFGNVSSVLIETTDVFFYMMRNPEGVLVFAASSATNLGTFKLKIEGLMENYLATVGRV